MYVDVGSSTTATTLVAATGAGTTNRQWRIKVTQIECSSLSNPPAGCVQYYTGLSGTATSYNFAGSIFLGSQNYATCVRAEAGSCGIRWTEISGTIDGFNVDGDIAPATESETTVCTQAYLMFPNIDISGATGQVCGSIFNPIGDQTTNSAFTQTATPFSFYTRSKAAATTSSGTGYSLNWNQVQC